MNELESHFSTMNYFQDYCYLFKDLSIWIGTIDGSCCYSLGCISDEIIDKHIDIAFKTKKISIYNFENLEHLIVGPIMKTNGIIVSVVILSLKGNTKEIYLARIIVELLIQISSIFENYSLKSKLDNLFIFTNRELEVFKLVHDGLKDKDIASNLNLSKSTIRKHLHSIYDKTSTKGKIDLLSKYDFNKNLFLEEI